MADQQRTRGRSRGRGRGTEGSGGRPGGPPQPRGGGGPPPPRGPPRGAPGPVTPAPPSAWGPPKPAQAPQQGGGRATQRGGVGAAAGELAGAVGGTSDSGNGNGGNGVRRGNVRGRRQMGETRTNILRTRPEALPSKSGTAGTVVHIKANYFKLLQKPDWCLLQYHVDIAPVEDRTSVKKALFRNAIRNVLTGGFIFDGAVLYTCQRLDPDPMEVFVDDQISGTRFKFTVRLTTQVSNDNWQYLQFLNILLRKCLGHLNMQLVGRNFFDIAAKIVVPEHKIELWPGYVTSIRQHEQNILMCVEVAHKVMHNDTVLSLLNECLQESRGNFRQLFTNRIIGTVILTDYNNRTYRIDDVDFNTTPQSSFDMRDGSKVSYIDYFMKKYNIRIRDVNQPMIISKAKAREIRAGMAEYVYLVPELCRLTGLTEAQRANFHFMKALANHTRMAPEPRAQRLLQFCSRLRNQPEVIRDLTQWDFKLADTLVNLPARILPPETLYGGKQGSNHVTYSAGRDVNWTNELRSKPMLHSPELSNWVVVCPSRNKQSAQSFVQMLIKVSKGMHWNLPFPKLKEIPDDRPGTYMTGLDDAIKTYNPQLALCVVGNNKADRYSAIKKKCYVTTALPSQVILARNLDSKGAMSIATKVAIQLNCKIGGAPWGINIPFSSVMVVGFDVCHDTNSKEKSFGAMVASLDSNCARYFSTVSHHKSGEELSNDFALNIIKACREFQKIHGSLPQIIFIYRDGVGDGQLSYCYEHEVQLIEERLKELYKSEGKTFKMAFIVVTKKINTRFFNNNNNPAPGTVVDDIVTLPERYDFFIVSQCVREGTVSPTSYNVLYDTTGKEADILQRFTYKLTHMYYNWSGTVRVPAPCQYAHKLAFLAGQHLHARPHVELQNTLFYL